MSALTEEENLSALQENIKRKGNNAYYYAHGQKIDGPQWDGKEEPRLLSVETQQDAAASAASTSSARPKQAITEYSWLDNKGSVKIYIEHSNASEILDSDVSLDSTDARIDFSFIDTVSGKQHVFALDGLNDTIEGASFVKKSGKFVITLKKSLETAWLKLKK